MNGRSMIVGREMIVGSHGHHPDDDMDELLHHTSVGAEHHPAEHAPQHAMAHPSAHERHRGRESRQYDYRPHQAPRHQEPMHHEAYYEEEPMPPPRRRAPPEHGP